MIARAYYSAPNHTDMRINVIQDLVAFQRLLLKQLLKVVDLLFVKVQARNILYAHSFPIMG